MDEKALPDNVIVVPDPAREEGTSKTGITSILPPLFSNAMDLQGKVPLPFETVQGVSPKNPSDIFVRSGFWLWAANRRVKILLPAAGTIPS